MVQLAPPDVVAELEGDSVEDGPAGAVVQLSLVGCHRPLAAPHDGIVLASWEWPSQLLTTLMGMPLASQ